MQELLDFPQISPVFILMMAILTAPTVKPYHAEHFLSSPVTWEFSTLVKPLSLSNYLYRCDLVPQANKLYDNCFILDHNNFQPQLRTYA